MELTLDFESRSPLDLKKCGMYVYWQNPRTEVMMLSVQKDDEPTLVWIPPKFRKYYDTEVSDEQLANWLDEAEIFIAHNAGFERQGFRYGMTKLGFPDLPLEKFRCTQAQSLMCALPRNLDNVASIVSGGKWLKDKAGHKLMLQMCKPRGLVKADCVEMLPVLIEKGYLPEGATWKQVQAMQTKERDKWLTGEFEDDFLIDLFMKYKEDETTFRRLVEYARQDVAVERNIYKKLPKMPESEMRVWYFDQRMNDKGIAVDRESAKTLKASIDLYIDQLSQEALSYTEGQVRTMESDDAIKAWLKKNGVETKSIDKYHVKEMLTLEIPDKVRKFLELKQKISGSSVSKYQSLRLYSQVDGRFRGGTTYHAASTGRYGGNGPQPHNFPRPSEKNFVRAGATDNRDEVHAGERDIPLLASCDFSLVNRS